LPYGFASHAYAYDPLNRLTNLVVDQTNGGAVASYDYALGAAGNRQSVTESNGRRRDYQYDDLYRLTRESISGSPGGQNGVVDYAYDQVGNRETRISTLPSVEAQSFTYSDNDLLDTDTYDANGNTTISEDLTDSSGGTASDVYSYRNRLIRRAKADGSVIDLRYDADANRVGKALRASDLSLQSSTSYLVDLNTHTGFAQVVEKYVDGSLEAAYTFGHDLISQDRLQPDPLSPGSEIFTLSFYLYDGHGTVRQLSDELGAVTDSYEYDAFGILLSVNGQTRNSYLYTGEQFDEDLGMYFLRARYLNTQTGRFHNMDTFEGRSGEPLTLHKHLYAHGNPVMNVDPSGHFSLAELQAAIGARQIIGNSARIRVVAAKKKAVKVLTCQVGVAFLKKQYKGDGNQGHHAIPKNVGGDPLQDLIFLPADTHRMFHWVLNVLLKGDPQFGGKGAWTSKENWSELTRTPRGRKQIYPFIFQASKLVDRACKLKGPASLQKFVRKNRKAFIYGGAK